jgi:hypothetical protein
MDNPQIKQALVAKTGMLIRKPVTDPGQENIRKSCASVSTPSIIVK